jgi:hypothetical protein
MRLIDADKIYVIPAEDDNITGMGMTQEEQDAYNDGVDAVMAKIRNAETVDAVSIDRMLEIIDEISDSTCITFGIVTYSDGKGELRNRILALKGERK